MARTASCACGQLKVACATEPVKVSLCHCRACQKRTGSAFGVAAFFSRRNVEIEGRDSLYRRSSDSGHDIVFHFCSDCGSTVYWEPQRKPGTVAVAVGAFADPTFLAPSQVVYGEHRHSWVVISI
jgi:hypothetical protein